MFYFKIIENGKVVVVGGQSFRPVPGEEITEEEYNQLMSEIEEKEKEKQKAVEEYVARVRTGEMTIEDVPEEYRQQVSSIISAEDPNNPYGLPNELYSEVEQGVVDKIKEGVSE